MKELYRFRQFLTEGVIKEESIPSGWTEQKDISHFNNDPDDKDKVLKVYSAPMGGWDTEHKDMIIIKIKYDYNPETGEFGDVGKYYLDGYVSFGDFEEQGPFNTYEEVLKLAVKEMEAFKKDWDE